MVTRWKEGVRRFWRRVGVGMYERQSAELVTERSGQDMHCVSMSDNNGVSTLRNYADTVLGERGMRGCD